MILSRCYNTFPSQEFVCCSSLLTIAIAFGFTISYLVYAIGHISGGHINPAVTFAFFTLKKITFRKLVTYSIAQFLGAVLGVFVLWGCTASLTSECEDKPDLVGLS